MSKDNLHIAIVDDEIEIHELFKINFKKEIRAQDYTFYYFKNGKDCNDFLETLDENTIRDIVILSDINMPVMDGLELLEHVKERHPKTELYIVTAYDNEEFKNKALRLGSAGFLPKPVDFDHLKSFFKSLANKRGLNLS